MKLCVNYPFIMFLRSNPHLAYIDFMNRQSIKWYIVLYGKWYMKSPRQNNKLFDIFLA